MTYERASASPVLQGGDSELPLLEMLARCRNERAGTVLATRIPALTIDPTVPDQMAADSEHKTTIVVKLRLRDKHAAELNRQARAVNFVWNY